MSSQTLNERRFQNWKFNFETRRTCDKCGKPVIWMKDEIGRNVPVNPVRACIPNLTSEKKRIIDRDGIIHDHTSKAKVLGWQIHWDICIALLKESK